MKKELKDTERERERERARGKCLDNSLTVSNGTFMNNKGASHSLKLHKLLEIEM